MFAAITCVTLKPPGPPPTVGEISVLELLFVIGFESDAGYAASPTPANFFFSTFLAEDNCFDCFDKYVLLNDFELVVLGTNLSADLPLVFGVFPIPSAFERGALGYCSIII